MSMTQSPAFTAAVQTYCQAYQSGIRDMRRLKPLIKRIDAAFVWTPRTPTPKPLTPEETADCIATWQALDAVYAGKITAIATDLLKMEPEERSRALDFWIAVMEAMKAA
jgi:hypothetical protein